ncbi:MAG TPA: radical SAM protein [Terriglobales bacterium]|jgi:radical SAM superfamily enzyme YgiQ (UPF0313 family)
MNVHLVNPSDTSFGTAVITPRWLYVLAAATPESFGDPRICDETLERFDPLSVGPGDVVGIGIHTGNALRGYEIGRMVQKRGAWLVFGGIHATLYPEEALRLGLAHSVVKGDGDVVWAEVLAACMNGRPSSVYEGGRIEAGQFMSARWDLLPTNRYMWPSVQTLRGCPKHCSFCSVWRTDGQRPRQRGSEGVIREIVQLRRMGFRFIALADDNFYPVTLTDLRLAERQNNYKKLNELRSIRKERIELMARLAELPADMVFYTQITMEAAEDREFLEAMRKARIKGALVGVEAVTPEGLKAVFKEFNCSGEHLVQRLQTFREHGVHVLGSFIFGLPTDGPATFDATAELAQRSGIPFAQFVMLTPFPGTVDFTRWEKDQGRDGASVNGTPLTRYWLIPPALRPKMFTPHPTMTSDDIRERTQHVWDTFYSVAAIWKRSRCVSSIRARLAFLFVSKLYRQMYAGTGIATDSARQSRARFWARLLAKPCRRLFQAKPSPTLEIPGRVTA